MKKFIFVWLFVWFFLNAPAQISKTDTDTTSSYKMIHIDEIVISPNRIAEKKSEIPYTIGIINTKDIKLGNQQTAADMLINTGSVFVQKSQQGGGSPILRGFEASRVLIVIDGVRMNNAIYRAGHLQDVITVDNSMLDRIEIIFGPSSTIYGSDALGGVMHFNTKNPVFGNEKIFVKGNAYVRNSTVNSEITGHFDVNLGWKRFASLTSFSYSNFGDLRSGKRFDNLSDSLFTRNYYVKPIDGVDSMIANPKPNIQRYSGYSQYDFLQKFAFKQNSRILHTLNFQYSNSSNIPRYDRLTEYNKANLKYAEWNYGPQSRLMASLNTQVISTGKLFNRVNIGLAGQSISQDRISRKFKNDNRLYQMEDVAVFSLNIDLMKKIRANHELRYGFEETYNDVKSTAKSVNIKTNVESAYNTRYPDGGSSMSSTAAYFSHKWKVSEKFIISDGLRFTASSLHAEFVDTSFFNFPFKKIDQSSQGITGNLGMVIKPYESLKISLVGSNGFRTPNVDDLTKIFDSSAGTLIVANPDLKPETAYNVELGIEQVFDQTIKVSVVGWYTKLVNAMVVKDFIYQGQDSIVYNGTISKVKAVQNANNGYITGITGTLVGDLNKHISFMSTATYTYGRYNETETNTVVPLDHISPLFGKIALIYNTNKVQAEVYAIYNGWKKLEDYSPSGEDNLQYATPEGTPSWITLNAKAAWQVNKNLMLQVAVEHLLDTSYRYFASGINAPGRNLSTTLRLNF